MRQINSIADIPNLRIIHKSATDPRISIVDRLSRAKLDDVQSHDFREMFTLARRTVSAVTTRSKSRDKRSEDLRSMNHAFWVKEQLENEDIRKAINWVKNGFPTKEQFKSNSQLLRSLFHNRESLFMKDDVLMRKWIMNEQLYFLTYL